MAAPKAQLEELNRLQRRLEEAWDLVRHHEFMLAEARSRVMGLLAQKTKLLQGNRLEGD